MGGLRRLRGGCTGGDVRRDAPAPAAADRSLAAVAGHRASLRRVVRLGHGVARTRAALGADRGARRGAAAGARCASGSRSRSDRARAIVAANPASGSWPSAHSRRQADPWKTQSVLVHEVARLPAGEELGVEAVQPLDLEERVGDQQHPPDDALDRAARRVDEAREGREVQRRLFARRAPEAARGHGRRGTRSARSGVSRSRRIERERDGRPSVARGEVQEAADAAVSRRARGRRGCRRGRPGEARRVTSRSRAPPRPPRQLRLTASSSASSASESSSQLGAARPRSPASPGG